MDFNFVFEGGGAKGLVFIGAMQAMEAAGYGYDRLMGTSAGAITATLLAAGYTTDELLAASIEELPDGTRVFSTFLDVPTGFDAQDIAASALFGALQGIDLPLIPERVEEKIDRAIMDRLMGSDKYRQIFSFIEKGGLYAGKAFYDFFQSKLDAGGRGLANATLAEMYAQTGRHLTLIAADTTGAEMLVLNHITAPDCPVVWAVRMSMSVPFLWQEVRWDAAWGQYRQRDISGHSIVDGGVLSNFPINLLISKDVAVRQMMGEHNGLFTIGMLIDETLPLKRPDTSVEFFSLADVIDKLKNAETTQRIMRLIDTMTQAHDRQVIQAYADGVIRLPAEGYGTTDFDMDDKRMHDLILSARLTTEEFLAGFTPPT